jgi:methionine synthase II (cobalamin-independent)
MADARRLTDHVLMAGLSRGELFTGGSADEVAAQVRDALAQTGSRGVIVAPGCVLPTTASRQLLDAILATVQGMEVEGG